MVCQATGSKYTQNNYNKQQNQNYLYCLTKQIKYYIYNFRNTKIVMHIMCIYFFFVNEEDNYFLRNILYQFFTIIYINFAQ